MLAAMVTAVLSRTLRHARDSWRGQICVLLAGGVVFALLDQIAGYGIGSGVASALAITLMLGAAVQAVGLELDAALAPRLIVQAFAATAPALLAGWVLLEVAGAVPVVGLLLVAMLFPLLLASAVVSMLAICAVAGGDRGWVPLVAWRTFAAQPMRLLGTFIVGMVALGMTAVPIVLVGFVLNAVAGFIGTFFAALAAAAIVPLVGCFALAMWEHADPPTLDIVPATPEPAGALEAFATPWVDGPSWTVTLEPGTVWGTWVRLEAAANIAIRVAWSGMVPPRLAVGGEDGTWLDPGQPVTNGEAIPAMLPAGNSYLQIGCIDAAPQAVTMTMLVRVATAA